MEKRLVLLLLIFLKLSSTFAQSISYSSEEMERILQVKTVGGIILLESLFAIEKNGKLFFPLNDFFESAGLAIKLSNEKLMGEGYIVNEDNPIRINFKECLFESKSQIQSFDCGDYFESSEGLFASTELLEKMLPMKINIDLLASLVFVESEVTLPPVAKLLRDKRKVFNFVEDEGEKEIEIKRNWFDGFNFDQDLSSRYKKNGISKKESLDVLHQTSVSAEVLKGELYSKYTGVNSHKESFWLSLERNDHRSRIFGDLGLSELKFYNFSTGSLKLIGGAKELKGLYFSNRPFSNASRFSKQDFSGPLDNGWEVELYHNDVLVGREVGSLEKQRYEFREVDLYYGKNNFHFVFYGPKGEKKHQYQDYNIENIFQKTERPIVTGAVGVDKDNQTYHYGEFDYLLFNRVFVEALQTRFTSKEEKSFYGLNLTTFIGGIVASVNNAYDQHSWAHEAAIKFSFLGINSNISYLQPNDFKSDLISEDGLIDVKKGTFLFPIPFMSNLQIFADLKNKKMKDATIWEKKVRLSLSLSDIYMATTYQDIDGVHNGEFFFRYGWKRNQFKLVAHTDDKELQDISIDVNFKNKHNQTLSLGTSYTTASRTEALSVRYDKLFEKFSLGSSFKIDDKENIDLAFNLSYGGVFEKEMGAMLFNKRTSEYGNAKIIVFVDSNANGEFDRGEDILPNVEFRKLAGNQISITDDKGRAFFSMLQPHRPIDFKVSMKNIENIFLKAKEEGFRLWPRPGKTSVVYFPVHIRGEIEGEVDFGDFKGPYSYEAFVENSKGEKRKVNIESDGYFLVDNIASGEFILEVRCFSCNDKIIRKNFNMPVEGDTLYIEGLKF